MRSVVDFRNNERGTVAVIFGASVFMLVGVVGLAVDFARAYNEKSALQNATDAAAMAGAAISDGDPDKRIAAATAVFLANYKSRTGGTATPTVAVDGSRIRVSATAVVPTTFARVIGFEALEVPSESESEAVQSSVGRACLLALNPSAPIGIDLGGTARLVATNCWAWSDATSAQSISGNGTSLATASGFCAVGGINGGDHFAPGPRANCPAVPDPYANLVLPLVGSCTATNLSLGPGSHTLNPGTYCGGIQAQASANLTFNPGVYVMKDGPLQLQGQSVSTGNGVVFYFTGSAGADSGLQIRGGAEVDFKAPMAGDLAGFVFVQDKYAQPGSTSRIAGGARIKLEGILYMPTWIVDVTGNGALFDEALVWSMIADRFIISGTGDIVIRADPIAAGLPDNLPQVANWMPRLTR